MKNASQSSQGAIGEGLGTGSMRVLLVDDEPLALDRLSDLLGQIESVEVIGSAVSGAKAIKAIKSERPDLVVLAIEMQRTDGFDVVEMLSRQSGSDTEIPLICFVTAYPQFAVNAFETGALDLLCKPVRFTRLEKAINRARRALEQREAARRLNELSSQLDVLRTARLRREERCLWIQQRGLMVRVEIAAVDWIEAEGEYVRLHLADNSHLLRSPISHLAQELEGDGFVRIHRSIVINQTRLTGVRHGRRGRYVVLNSGIELPVGRKYRHAVQRIISG